MVKLRSAVFVLVALGWAVCGVAQDGEPNYNTQDNANLIENWLHGSDQRLLAFGANFASESNDEAEVTTLLQLVAKWDPSPGRYASEEQVLAMSEVLHALIQRNVQVPAEDIGGVATYFPVQSVILASRLPANQATDLLESWYESGETAMREGSRTNPDVHRKLLLGRVAAMMLAQAPPPGFAASMLVQSEERLVVTVTTAGYDKSERCGSQCGAWPATVCATKYSGPPFGEWPPLYQYTLEENGPGGWDGVVVEAGGDQITYRRNPANVTGDSCSVVAPLSSENRHHLLAQMLGENERAMLWRAEKDIKLTWNGKEQYQTELGKRVELEEARLRATVSDFYAKGLVTLSEVDTTRPRLSILVFDDRLQAQPANAALPPLAVRDSRTVFAFNP